MTTKKKDVFARHQDRIKQEDTRMPAPIRDVLSASKPERSTRLRDATTPTTTHVDGVFERTALVIGDRATSGSVDLVDKSGTRLAQVNVFLTEEGTLMVDVIDVDHRFTVHRGLGFAGGQRQMIKTGDLVAAHFEGRRTRED